MKIALSGYGRMGAIIERVAAAVDLRGDNQVVYESWHGNGNPPRVQLLASGVGDQLTLDNLKARHGDLDALVEARPVPVMAGYFLVYVAFAALSIPGAAVMTLAGGAIFTGVGLVVAYMLLGSTWPTQGPKAAPLGSSTPRSAT